METATSDDQQKLISSFMEIAVNQTNKTAITFLKATNWNLEEAINLFLTREPEEQIPLPLPSKKLTLYDSSSMSLNSSVQVSPEKVWDSKPGPSDSSSSGSDSSLSSLFRPPHKLLFKGSFEEAKSTSSREDRWLLVNLQSMTEFACHTLNRDLWSDDAVSQAVESSFVLCQVYDHTDQGKKISSFYRIESVPPVVLLIDPITGQKMRSWSGGNIEAQSFLEDLMKYIDASPQEHIASRPSNKRIKTEQICSDSNHNTTNQDKSTSCREEPAQEQTLVIPEEEDTCSSSNHIGEEPEKVKNEETCLEFPYLTEEPKGDYDGSLVCSVCVRFPDGRRKQRRFLKTEPVQLLWSFCYSQMNESDEKKAFKLVQAIPCASKTLDYGANITFDQSRIANSIISVTWE